MPLFIRILLLGSKYRFEEAHPPLLVTYHLIDNLRCIRADCYNRVTHIERGHDDPHEYHQKNHQ